METVEVLEPKGNNYIGKTHVKTYTSFTAAFVVNTLTYVYKDSYDITMAAKDKSPFTF